jgi:hypothetical protein
MIALILRVLGPVVEMLGQAVGGGHVREVLGLAERFHVALVHAGGRVAYGLRVLRVHRVGAERRFERLVMLREGAFRHQLAAEQAGNAFRVHDERHAV